MKKIPMVLALAAALAAAVPANGQEVVEEIVAVVNDDIITLSEIREQYRMAENQLRAMQLEPEQYEKQMAQLKSQLLEAMITDRLVLQKAKELNISVNEQLRAAIEKIKADNNLSSDDDLKRAVEQQGMAYDAWLKEYEESILKQAVIFTEVERSIALDDAEIVKYYREHPEEFTLPTEYKLHAIYLDTAARAAEELAALEARIDERLAAGADFAEVAAELSDPPMKEAKGDLGTFKQGELDESLEAVAAALKPGETSPWTLVRGGRWLIRLESRTDSRLLSFEEARKDVEAMLYNRLRAEKGEEYVKGLRAKSYVKILRPDPLDR